MWTHPSFNINFLLELKNTRKVCLIFYARNACTVWGYSMPKKNILFKIATFSALALLFTAPLAFADDDDDDPYADQTPLPGPVVDSQKTFTDISGFYIQGQGVYSFGTSIKDQPLTSGLHTPYTSATQTYKTHGFGGRVSAGYDLGPFSLEIGAFLNPSQTSTLTAIKEGSKALPDVVPKDDNQSTPDQPMDKLSSFGADLVAKLKIPFQDGIYGFVGGGVAWTYYKYTNLDPNGAFLPNHQGVSNRSWTKLSPEVLLGLGYGISSNMALTCHIATDTIP